MENKELLQHCKDLAFSGKDYEFIRGYLEQQKLNEENKMQVLVKADEYLAHYQFALQQRSKAGQQMIMGIGILCIGIFVYLTIASNLGKESFLAVALILGGGWILKEGYKAYRIPLEDLDNPLNAVSRKIQR